MVLEQPSQTLDLHVETDLAFGPRHLEVGGSGTLHETPSNRGLRCVQCIALVLVWLSALRVDILRFCAMCQAHRARTCLLQRVALILHSVAGVPLLEESSLSRSYLFGSARCAHMAICGQRTSLISVPKIGQARRMPNTARVSSNRADSGRNGSKLVELVQSWSTWPSVGPDNPRSDCKAPKFGQKHAEKLGRP